MVDGISGSTWGCAGLLGVALLLGTSGCRERESVYRYREVLTGLEAPSASTSSPASSPAPALPAATGTAALPPAATLPLAWELPAGWEELPAGGMRQAAFQLPDGGGECTIIVLGGMAGGAGANIRRWMEQLNLALTEEAFDAFLASGRDRVSEGGLAGTLYDFTTLGEGDAAPSALAGIFVVGHRTVFVKASGPRATLTTQREAFEALCLSLRLGAGEAE